MNRSVVFKIVGFFVLGLAMRGLGVAAVLGQDFRVWDWFGVNACEESEPAVAFNSSLNEYLVVFVWNLAGNTDIVAVRVSAGGGVVGAPFSVTSTASNDITPAIARNSYDGEYLVVWQRWSSTSGFDIYGRIISHTGVLGAEFDIAAFPGNQQSAEVVYSFGPSRYLVVWEENDSSVATIPDVSGRCVSDTGALLYSTINVAWYPGNQTQPAVAINPYDYTALVTWRDDRSGSVDIVGRKVVTLGTCGTVGLDVDIGPVAGSAGGPAVAWGQTNGGYGEYFTAWVESNFVLGRRVDAETYTPVGPGFGVSVEPSLKGLLAVTWTGARNEWWVVWGDNRDGDDFIYGQALKPDGTRRFDVPNQRVSLDPVGLSPSELQVGPDLYFDSTTGSALVAWTDSGHFDIGDAGIYGVWGRHWVWPVLFADGFESGNTTAWSASIPAP